MYIMALVTVVYQTIKLSIIIIYNTYPMLIYNFLLLVLLLLLFSIL